MTTSRRCWRFSAGYRPIELRAARVLARVAEAAGDTAEAARLDERAALLAKESGYAETPG